MIKNKRGFTLIELLAVIIILAVIALITAPIVISTIENSKKGAAKDSLYGYLKASQLSINNNSDSENMIGTYTINSNGNLAKDGKEYRIDISGSKPTFGSVTINAFDQIGALLKFGNYCVVKYLYDDEAIILPSSESCNNNLSNNLVKNGYGELNNNTNFPGLTFLTKSFSTPSNADRYTFYSGDFIPVDTSKTYEQKMDIKATNASSTNLIGFSEYDIDQKQIISDCIMFTNNSLATLTKDLNNGDTVVYLDSLSTFLNSSGLPTYQLGLIFWNYQDSTGYKYPEKTYSRNIWQDLYLYTGINKSNNTITLKKAWDKGTIKAGTKLSQSASGSTVNYGIGKLSTLSNTFVTKTNIINGTLSVNDGYVHTDSFRPGTKYIKIYATTNYNEIGTNSLSMKNVSFKQID